ncbi:MAG: chloride channel protein [Arhodomonas sp.]|nr:chloride channel protein [Arhodomonas sp.]
MFPPRRWHRHWHRFQERLNLRLSAAEALVGLCLLGALTGLMAGAVNLAFRGAVELTQATFLDSEEAYEGLPWWARMGLPLLGGAAIWGYLRLAGGTDARTGVVYVIERTVYHQGYLGLRNAVTQFVAGAIAIISGHSVGREGPSVHLGATAGSLLGQRLRVPNNSMRTLVACGAAAAIGASFNTPLAGVAFAMEVVVMEYTIAGFLPVILAAGVATAMTHFFYGAAPAFSVPAIAAERLWELPVIALTGFAIGLLAALFNGGLTWTTRHTEDYPLALRLLAAGAAVGLIAVAVPEVMGIGYDTVGLALIGELAPLTLIAIAAAKLLATSVSLGLGHPGGTDRPDPGRSGPPPAAPSATAWRRHCPGRARVPPITPCSAWGR